MHDADMDTHLFVSAQQRRNQQHQRPDWHGKQKHTVQSFSLLGCCCLVVMIPTHKRGRLSHTLTMTDNHSHIIVFLIFQSPTNGKKEKCDHFGSEDSLRMTQYDHFVVDFLKLFLARLIRSVLKLLVQFLSPKQFRKYFHK